MSGQEPPGESDYKQGLKYYNGDGIDVDTREAEKCFKLAADKGHVKAQYQLGHIYIGFNGSDGVKMTNIEEGIRYLKLAAEKGNTDAITDLIYMYGDEDSIDIKKMIHYAKLGVQQGHLHSLRALGEVYFNGEGVPKDIEQGIHYLTLAADKGDMESQHMLGEMYVKGTHRSGGFFTSDLRQGIHYLTLAAGQGNVSSLGLLGYTYFKNGNKERSIEHLKLAANQGNVDYFAKAARHDPDIQYSLGIHYIELAVRDGHPDARRLLKCLEPVAVSTPQHAVRVHPGGNKKSKKGKSKKSKKSKKVKK